MAQQPVAFQKMGQGGKVLKLVDERGGVFRPVPEKGQQPVYTCGPTGDGVTLKDPLILYQCPVSAIPDAIWELLQLWWACRLTGLPPVAGGFLAQPVLVQLTFPMFEAMMRGVEANERRSGAYTAAGMAVAGMTKVLMGGS